MKMEKKRVKTKSGNRKNLPYDGFFFFTSTLLLRNSPKEKKKG